jgi:hypothetical protein
MEIDRPTDPEGGWNLFAVVLNVILARSGRNASLDLLDDRGDFLLRVHREKVRRLKRSLAQPNTFPVLNPKELDAVSTTYQFSPEELRALRAALLATAILEKLADRIEIRRAWQAAWEIYPLIEQAMREHDEQEQDDQGLGGVRPDEGDESEALSVETPLEYRYANALDRIERAQMAFMMSQEADAPEQRAAWRYEALDGYRAGIAQLATADEALQQTDAWHYWMELAKNRCQKLA